MTLSPVARRQLESAQGLNVGSGPHYAEGWFNIDVTAAPEGHRDPDEIMDVFELHRYPADIFERAYVGHVLEHLPWRDVPGALQAVAWVVKPGGTIMVVGPCILRAVGQREPMELIDAILADPRHYGEPWAHQWTPTLDLTVHAVNLAGLDAVVLPIEKVDRPEWPNPSTAQWQVAVAGLVR